MELRALIEGLSRPAAWPEPPRRVELVQTHASVVFLGGSEARKIKKPVDLGFLDFSTLERRRTDCEAELVLNRRLAPRVYLGVEAITLDSSTGRPRFGGEGEPIEWAVRMRRLPEERTFRSLLESGRLGAPLLRRFARMLAAFFASAEKGPAVQDNARFEVVERNLCENFEQAASGAAGEVLDRFRELCRAELAARRELIESRAERGLARDGHGDLRLDHAYLLDGDELVVIDCIEFDDRFRFQDPVCDVAFLVMELGFAGRRELAERFAKSFLEASDDREGHALLPLFVAYRHAVRAKVRSLEAEEPEVPQADRERARRSARAHWLAGLAELAPPGQRPGLVLVGGPPASGKSTLSRGLAESADLARVSSDETRKRLAGLSPGTSARAVLDQGIYSEEWSDRTYDDCLRRARERLLLGGRVVVDASFREEGRRRPFLELARELGLRAVWLECELSAEEARRRLLARGADPSDADLEVQRRARAAWEPPSAFTGAFRCLVSTEETAETSLRAALGLLRERGLA